MKVRLFLTVMLFCATANAQQAITPEETPEEVKEEDTKEESPEETAE